VIELQYPDDLIRGILRDTKTVAVVGASANPARPSHGVMRWLIGQGYKVAAVNPGLSGTLLGAPVYPRLSDVPEPIDMVDVFRNSDAVPAIVDEALVLPNRPKVIWMQLDVHHAAAAEQARAAGITVVMDRCPVIEAGRLGWS
jgi:predicted CoA-binding protein